MQKKSVDKHLRQRISQAGNNRKSAINRANAIFYHLIWKKIAKNNGWEYEKAKTV